MLQTIEKKISRVRCDAVIIAAIAATHYGHATVVAQAPTPAPNEFQAIEQELEKRWKAEKLPSLSAGIVRGDKLVYAKSFGLADRRSGRAAAPETLYRIGSITKVFTATLLGILRDEKKLMLDDPVSKYLPPEVRLPNTSPAGPITLRHLATHSSGLPRLPVNLVARGGDPYGGYSTHLLYRGLESTKLEFATGTRESYSNLGFGLLGHALERAAGEPYETLIKRRICEPLGMRDTTIALTAEQRERFATGYREDAPTREAVDWDLGCLAPAGAIASSVNELAKFVSAQFHAGDAEPSAIAGRTLAELHARQKLFDGTEMRMGIGWVVQQSEHGGETIWHNGGMAGYHSYLGFAPTQKTGVIVLTNSGKDIDAIGRWLLAEAVSPSAGRVAAAVDPAVRTVAQALATHFVAAPADSLGDLFHENFLAAIPLTRIKPLFRDIFQRLGKPEGFDVEAGTRPRTATIVFRFAKAKTVRCRLELDRGEPPKIVYLLLQP